jgi:hypothetical protein
MEISMNLGPSISAHSISYVIMKWDAGFLLCIPVAIDTWHRIDSHIDENPKERKNLRRSNWFPGKLIMGVMESAVLSS